MTLETFWMLWLWVFSLGITALALFFALFVKVTDMQQAPAYVRHLRWFGIALMYGGVLLVATEYLGVFAGAAKRALGL